MRRNGSDSGAKIFGIASLAVWGIAWVVSLVGILSRMETLGPLSPYNWARVTVMLSVVYTVAAYFWLGEARKDEPRYAVLWYLPMILSVALVIMHWYLQYSADMGGSGAIVMIVGFIGVMALCSWLIKRGRGEQ